MRSLYYHNYYDIHIHTTVHHACKPSDAFALAPARARKHRIKKGCFLANAYKKLALTWDPTNSTLSYRQATLRWWRYRIPTEGTHLSARWL